MIDRQEELREQIDSELAKLESKTEKTNETDSKDLNLEVNNQDNTNNDPFLEEAMKMGFDPEYTGPNKKSAEQFVKDGSFFKKIEDLKKSNEETKKLVKQLAEHNARLEKASYEKAKADIEAAKLAAVAEGDIVKFKTVQDQEKIVDANHNIPKVNIAPEISQDLLDFQERNKDWFNNQTDENMEMAEAADFIDKRIAKQASLRGMNLSQSEHLKLVEDKIKKLYPHRFENDNQKKASLVTKSTVSEGSSKDELTGRLTAQQKDFVKKARMYGSSLTESEYAKQLKMTGHLND